MNKKVLVDALETIIELADGNRLDIDDSYFVEDLQKQASYQDNCFDIVSEFVTDLRNQITTEIVKQQKKS